MPRWPQAPRAEDHLQAALTTWRVGSLYKSAEVYTKAHKVPPMVLLIFSHHGRISGAFQRFAGDSGQRPGAALLRTPRPIRTVN